MYVVYVWAERARPNRTDYVCECRCLFIIVFRKHRHRVFFVLISFIINKSDFIYHDFDFVIIDYEVINNFYSVIMMLLVFFLSFVVIVSRMS